MKKLYLIKTHGMGEFYVVAETFNDAADAFIRKLEVKDAIEYDNSRISTIEIVTEESVSVIDKKTLFTQFKRLIIA